MQRFHHSATIHGFTDSTGKEYAVKLVPRIDGLSGYQVTSYKDGKPLGYEPCFKGGLDKLTAQHILEQHLGLVARHRPAFFIKRGTIH